MGAGSTPSVVTALMVRMMDAGVRGANPWCGWLRFVLLPAFLVPMALVPGVGGVLAGLLLMAVWMLAPMAFRKPVSDTAWMSRAALGTQVWRSRRLDDPLALLWLGLLVLSLAVAAATLDPQQPLPLAATLVVYILSHLAFLARAARCYEARLHPGT